MNKAFISILFIVIATLIGVGGDMLIKQAALQRQFSGWPWLVGGAVVYGLTAFVWFFVFRYEKVSIIGALYSITIALILFLLGVFFYKEKVTPWEVAGLVMGITSLIILFRFA